MAISMIAAIGKNNELGLDNKLLWDIKEDMAWFKDKTMLKTVVMGRSTYESIGRPLPKRVNVVLSRDKNYSPHPEVQVRHSVEQVLMYDYEDYPELMIIGGAEIYEQFFPYATKLYLTEIDKGFKADTYFPEFDKSEWGKYFSKKGTEDVGFDYHFNVYKRQP